MTCIKTTVAMTPAKAGKHPAMLANVRSPVLSGHFPLHDSVLKTPLTLPISRDAARHLFAAMSMGYNTPTFTLGVFGLQASNPLLLSRLSRLHAKHAG